MQTGRLSEFVNEFIEIHNREQEERTSWEFYLHRVFEQTYSEFLDAIHKNEQADITNDNLQAIVRESVSVLSGFNPSTD